jgi:hypothetical protein
LILQPADLVHCCAALVGPALQALRDFLTDFQPQFTLPIVLLTAAAGRLPGLVEGVQACLDDLGPREDAGPADEFSIVLPDEEDPRLPPACVLPADTPARAAHALGALWLRQELPTGHLNSQVPLPRSAAAEPGLPRLHFQGQDYLLSRPSFSLGRQPNCDLVVDGAVYPAVAPWHCEIMRDCGAYVLRDWSRTGTLLNGRLVDEQIVLRPGDWIQLGEGGPRLRFLGQAADPRRLVTTA